MREWLLLGVIALGGFLGIWLLFFKSLAALYEMWQSGREFEKLKREAASRRMQRPSELMQKKKPQVDDNDSDMPVIPQAFLDSLSDEEADPLMVPQKGKPAATAPPPAAPPAQIEAEPQAPPAPSPPATEQVDPSTTSTPSPPTFPLPSADEATPADKQPESKPPESPSPSEAPNPEQHPPRYD